MSGRLIGDAWVSILPETSTFRAKADAAIKQSLAGLKPNVTITPNVSQAALTKTIAQIQGELKALSKGSNVVIQGNTSMLAAKLAALQAQAAAVQSTLNKGGGGGDLLNQTSMAAAINDLGKMDDRLQNLRDNLSGTGVTGDEAFKAITAALATAEDKLSNFKANGIGTAADVQGVSNLDRALKSLESTMSASAAGADSATRHFGLFGAAVSGLQHHTQLFGGALEGILPDILASVSGWHMLMEAVIETSAIWVPAAVAVGVFGIAAFSTAKMIVTQFDHMNTAALALNQTMPGLSGSFARMENAAKPQVIQLLGDALLIAGHNTGTMGAIAASTGNDLDKLGARIVAAMTSSQGMGKMAQTASQDMNLLFTAFGNLFGVIGNLMKVVPGYATDLLKIGTASLAVAENVTRVLEPVLKVGLAFHGAWVYLGLFGTLLTKIIVGGLSSIAGLAAKAATGLSAMAAATEGTALAGFSTAAESASTSLFSFSKLATGAASLPWGWITVVAGAVAYLGYQFATAKNTTEQWISSVQSSVTNAALSNVLAANTAALQQENGALKDAWTQFDALANVTGQGAAAQAKLTSVLGSSSAGFTAATPGVQTYNSATESAASRIKELTTATAAQVATGKLVSSRMTDLATKYGSTSAAMALMNSAGITSAQITDKNNSNWAQAEIMIQAQAVGYQELTLGAGRYGAAVNALGNNLTQYDGNMSKITQSQDTLMGTITGSESAFTSWAQGLNTLGSDSTATSTAMTGLSKSSSWSALKSAANQLGVSINGIGTQSKAFGVLSAAAKKSTTYVGGLSSTSLQLTSDFYSSVTGAQSLISSLENQGISTKNLTKTVATQASQMLSYAGGNKAAEATIISLINDAVGPGTVSFSNLNTWVKHNSTSMSGLDSIVGQTTIAAAGMAGTIGTLTKTLFAQDLMLASGVTPAVNAYAQSIAKSGQNSDATKGARAQLIKDLENSGLSAQNATNYVNNLTTGLNNLPKNVNTNITDNLTGNGTIKATSSITGQSTSMIGQLKFVAAGGHITGPGSGTSDSIPAMLSNGEYVVNAGAVSKYGKGMMDAINGKHFAAGGLATTVPAALTTIGNMIPDSNNWSTTFAQNAGTAFAKAASTQAQNSFNSSGNQKFNASAGVNQWRSVVLQALALNGLPASMVNQVLYQMMTESGGNPNAVNLTDSNAAAGDPSRGLLQTIGSTFAAYHIAGTSENIFNPLANVAAAINYAKHEYGPSLMSNGMGLGSGHGYSAGGVTPEGIIGVGMRSGSPYTIGTGEYVGPLMGNSIGAMTGGSTNLLIPILQEQNRLLAKANQIAAGTPQNYAQGLNNAVNGGVNRAYFAAGS